MALTADESKLVKALILADAGLKSRVAARDLCRQSSRYASTDLPRALEDFLLTVEKIKKNIDIANRV